MIMYFMPTIRIEDRERALSWFFESNLSENWNRDKLGRINFISSFWQDNHGFERIHYIKKFSNSIIIIGDEKNQNRFVVSIFLFWIKLTFPFRFHWRETV